MADVAGDTAWRVHVVDVFATAPLCGNPAAIVTGVAALDDDRLQRIARFLNLSETVFLFPPRASGGDYLARTFTTRREIPFAGHATLAAAHVYAEANAKHGWIVQECSTGLLRVERRPGPAGYFLDLPPGVSAPSAIAPGEVRAALGLGAQDLLQPDLPVAGAGPRWLLVEVATCDALSRIIPDLDQVATLCAAAGAVGLSAFSRTPADPEASIHLRAFAPAAGILEDPVCGSCAGAIASHLGLGRGRPEVTHMAQGRSTERSGLITIEAEPGPGGVRLRLGGTCETALVGDLEVAPWLV